MNSHRPTVRTIAWGIGMLVLLTALFTRDCLAQSPYPVPQWIIDKAAELGIEPPGEPMRFDYMGVDRIADYQLCGVVGIGEESWVAVADGPGIANDAIIAWNDGEGKNLQQWKPAGADEKTVQIMNPTGIARDKKGRIYVANNDSEHSVLVFDRDLKPSERVKTGLKAISSMAIDANGRLYVSLQDAAGRGNAEVWIYESRDATKKNRSDEKPMKKFSIEGVRELRGVAVDRDGQSVFVSELGDGLRGHVLKYVETRDGNYTRDNAFKLDVPVGSRGLRLDGRNRLYVCSDTPDRYDYYGAFVIADGAKGTVQWIQHVSAYVNRASPYDIDVNGDLILVASHYGGEVLKLRRVPWQYRNEEPAGDVIAEACTVEGKINADSYRELSGKWSDSMLKSALPELWGLRSRCADVRGGSARAEFTPLIAVPGTYEVYATWPATGNLTQVVYKIQNRLTGQEISRKIEQSGILGVKGNGHAWQHLGTMECGRGRTVRISVEAPAQSHAVDKNATPTLSADAVRLHFVRPVEIDYQIYLPSLKPKEAASSSAINDVEDFASYVANNYPDAPLGWIALDALLHETDASDQENALRKVLKKHADDNLGLFAAEALIGMWASQRTAKESVAANAVSLIEEYKDNAAGACFYDALEHYYGARNEEQGMKELKKKIASLGSCHVERYAKLREIKSLLETHKLEKAESEIARLVEQEPSVAALPYASRLRIEILLAAKKADPAVRLYQSLPEAQKLLLASFVAEQLSNLNDDEAMAEIVRSLEETMKKSPSSSEAGTAGTLSREIVSQHYERRLRSLGAEFAGTNEGQQALESLATYYAAQKRWDKADAIYRELLKEGSYTEGASADYVRFLVENKDYRQALDVANKMAATNDKEKETLEFLRAWLTYMSDDEENAQKQLTAFLAAHPKSRNALDAHEILADLYCLQHLYSKAIEQYQKVFEESQEKERAIRAQLAIVEIFDEEWKLYDDAIEACKKIIERFPDDEEATRCEYRIASYSYKKKDYKQAIFELTKFTEKHPFPEATLLLGLSYLADQGYDDAIATFERIVKDKRMQSYADRAIFLIAYCYQTQQKYAEAYEQFQRLLELYPTSTYAEKSREYVGKLESLLKTK